LNLIFLEGFQSELRQIEIRESSAAIVGTMQLGMQCGVGGHVPWF
jgi:hypothetical protein